MVSIISDHASLNANYEAILKQASNANAELSRRLENEHNDEVRKLEDITDNSNFVFFIKEQSNEY